MKMKQEKLFSLSIGIVALLIAGCAETQMSHGLGKAKDDISYMKDNNELLTKKAEKEILVNEKFVRIEVPTKVSEVLAKLGKLHNKIYIYKDSVDPVLTPSEFKIKNFRDLDHYLETTTQYKLKVTQNRYYKNMPKIITLSNKNDKFNVLKHKFVINGRIPLYKAFELLSHSTGYSTVYNYQDFSTLTGGTTSDSTGSGSMGNTGTAGSTGTGEVSGGLSNMGNNDFFSKRYINFTGKTVEQFVEYVKESFNLFVDFDHENKIVRIDKYHTKMYQLNVNDVKMSEDVSQNSITASVTSGGSGSGGGSNAAASSNSTGGGGATGGGSGSGGVSSGGTSGGSQTGSFSLADTSLFNEIEKDVSKVIAQDASVNPKSYYTVNNTMGLFVVKASPSGIDHLDRLFSFYNVQFDRRIKVTLDIYDIAIKNEQGLSTSLNYSYLSGDKALTIAQKAATQTSSLVQFYASQGSSSIEAFLDTASKIGRVVDHITYSTILKNYVPEATTRVDITNYIQSVNTDYVTSNNNVIPVRSPVIGQYQEGSNIFMLAKIINHRIHLKFSPVFSKLQNLEKSTIDNTEVTLPTINYTNPVKDITLGDGERRIALASVRFNRSHDYEGVLPIDDFAIMGDTAHGMIRTETVFIVSAKIMD